MAGEPLRPDQVATLLDAKVVAHIPRDRLALIAAMLESLRGNLEWRRQRQTSPISREEQVVAEAQTLIDKLRKLSPSVLAALRDPRDDEFASELADAAEAFDVWISSAPVLYPDDDQKTEWHSAAMAMLTIYKRHVDGAAGRSKDGAAVRFIAGALHLCGYGRKELGTVSQALLRYT